MELCGRVLCRIETLCYHHQSIKSVLHEDLLPAKCRNEYSIEDPGMLEVGGKFSYTFETPCLEMQEDFPLKVFAAKEVISKSMDGVVRNIVFENTATDTSIDTTC